jgi:hypothetical protein
VSRLLLCLGVTGVKSAGTGVGKAEHAAADSQTERERLVVAVANGDGEADAGLFLVDSGTPNMRCVSFETAYEAATTSNFRNPSSP